MKCQTLFSLKSIKNYFQLSSAVVLYTYSDVFPFCVDSVKGLCIDIHRAPRKMPDPSSKGDYFSTFRGKRWIFIQACSYLESVIIFIYI